MFLPIWPLLFPFISYCGGFIKYSFVEKTWGLFSWKNPFVYAMQTKNKMLKHSKITVDGVTFSDVVGLKLQTWKEKHLTKFFSLV